MANITQQIPNFLGGVSTQPDDQKQSSDKDNKSYNDIIKQYIINTNDTKIANATAIKRRNKLDICKIKNQMGIASKP